MAKVIERGHVPEESMYEYRCTRCNSLIQFCWDDVYADQRDGAYVKCPVCQVFIAWENVKQWGKQILK